MDGHGDASGRFAAGRFAALVARQADRFFDDLLPRFLARYYRGAGQTFVLRLLEALDQDDLEGLDGAPPPPRWARRRAARVRRNCPLVAVAQAPPVAPGVLLGQFFSRETWVSEGLASYRTLAHARWIEIYESSFVALHGDAAEALGPAVFRTIVHEYVHFFESFLLRSEQALRGREEWDETIRRITPAQAARRDRRAVWRRRLAWTVLAVVVLVPIGGLVYHESGLRDVPFVEDDGALARLGEARDALRAEQDRLAAAAAAPEETRTALAAGEAELAGLRERDAAFSADRVREQLTAAAPHGRQERRFPPSITLSWEGGVGETAATLDRLARALPTAALEMARIDADRAEIEVRPRAVPAAPASPDATFDRGALEAPVFESDEGEALRAEVRGLLDAIAATRQALGPLVRADELRQVLGLVRAESWDGARFGQAACLLRAQYEETPQLGAGHFLFRPERAVFAGTLATPDTVVADVICGGGRWHLESATEVGLDLSGRDRETVSLVYGFERVEAPLPYGSGSVEVVVSPLTRNGGE